MQNCTPSLLECIRARGARRGAASGARRGVERGSQRSSEADEAEAERGPGGSQRGRGSARARHGEKGRSTASLLPLPLLSLLSGGEVNGVVDDDGGAERREQELQHGVDC
jgi:hypothetical protein